MKTAKSRVSKNIKDLTHSREAARHETKQSLGNAQVRRFVNDNSADYETDALNAEHSAYPERKRISRLSTPAKGNNFARNQGFKGKAVQHPEAKVVMKYKMRNVPVSGFVTKKLGESYKGSALVTPKKPRAIQVTPGKWETRGK